MSAHLAALLAAMHPWADWTYAAATSWAAWRIYAVLGACVVLAVSFWIARSQRGGIFELRPNRGPRPRVLKTINKRLRELDEFEKAARLNALKKATLVIFFGFIVPSVILALGVYRFSWFFPGSSALAASACPRGQIGDPTLVETGTYVFSQLFMGVSGVFGEVAPQQFTTHLPSFVPANTIAADGLLLYRYYVAAFATLFLNLLAVAWNVSREKSIVAKRAELEEAREKATH